MLEFLNVLLTINYNIAVLGKWGRERSCKRDKIIVHHHGKSTDRI